MKIRTDFVTNSSSSSFVAYNLTDSEFCRYVYQKMKEKNLSYNEYSDERVSSYVGFKEDSLNAEISNYGWNAVSLYCNEAYFECDWEWCCCFEMKIEDIENYILDESAKETFRQIINEELKDKSFEELIGDDYDDWWECDYDRYHRKKEISDYGKHFHLCSRLFSLLSECE